MYEDEGDLENGTSHAVSIHRNDVADLSRFLFVSIVLKSDKISNNMHLWWRPTWFSLSKSYIFSKEIDGDYVHVENKVNWEEATV